MVLVVVLVLVLVVIVIVIMIVIVRKRVYSEVETFCRLRGRCMANSITSVI